MSDSKHRVIKTIISKYFQEYFDMPNITEICYNGKELIHVLDNNGWQEYSTELTYDSAFSFAKAIAVSRGKIAEEKSPILSADLPTGERIQIVMPPATDRDMISISIRIPSKTSFTFEDYEKSGFFDEIKELKSVKSESDLLLEKLYKEKQYSEFLKKAVEFRKTLIFAGKTGSGKTTLEKTFIDFIPTSERLISIEDTREIEFTRHKNSVNLYYPDTAKEGDSVTSSLLLKSCLRMKPDRILLTEVRGASAFDFIDAVMNGHYGSITSLHAGTVPHTFSRLINMYKSHSNAQGTPYDIIEKDIKEVIDIIICMTQDVESGKRYITDIYYKDVDYDIN